MTRSSRGGRFTWHCTLAVAVMAGAGGAYTYAVSEQGNAADQPVRTAVAAGPASGGPAATAPAVLPVLPFNAKLTSHDIPVAGGGVRDGGCSGALIDPDWIVTAGHCFHDIDGARVGGRPQYRMTVTVGKTRDGDPDGRTADVVDVRQSPVNDLAVAKLSTPVTGIVPLTLPGRPPTAGQHLQFAGWGSTSATVVVPSDHLKRGQFEVSKIKASTLEADPLVPRTVENSPCHDDSGAPYFVSADDVTGELVAIEDSGPECPQPGTEILARVDVVVGWIQ
ncbi:trypsin-like serine protease, partial [Amycolatopsis acidiphila]